MSNVTICALCRNQLSFAKLLPCLDSFCLKCLEDLDVDGVPGGELLCPRCGETFRIPDDGMSALPANRFVDNLLRIKKGAGAEKDLGCDVCASEADRSSPVTSYCLDCDQNMCRQCSGYHTKFASTRGHEVVAQGPEDRTSVRMETSRWCDSHQNRRQELYCRDCGSAICLKCYTEKHNSHACSDIGAVADELCEQMRQTVDEMEQLSVDVESEERHLRRARDDILDQVTEAEFTVLRGREDLVSCVERDANELMNDLQHFRDFVTSEYEASSKKVGKRSAQIHNFKVFARELLNEGSASAVADVAGILNQRAAEIRLQSQNSGVGNRPTVEVTFQPLGLSRLSQAKSRRKINVVGRVTATILSSEVMQPGSGSMPMTRLPTETMPKHPFPVFEFGASATSSRESVSKNRRSSHLVNPRIKDSQNSGAVGGCRPQSRVYHFAKQTQQSKAASSTSSSSDEGSLYNSDEDAVSQPAAEAVLEDLGLLDTAEDSGSSTSVVIFSHKAKLRRFVSGSWRTRGVGFVEVLRLLDNNVAYLIMKNRETQKIYVKQSITCDMSLEPVPESDGRELTWTRNAVSDDGHYDMFMVRFKSKIVAANFRMAFICARELLMLGIRCKTVVAIISDVVSTSSAAVKNEEHSTNCD